MTKKRYIISFALAVMSIPLLTGGGIHIFSGPQYRYDHRYQSLKEGKGFIPSQFHIEYKVSKTTVIPFFLYIVNSEIPKALNISKHDITYLKNHEGFTHFRIDELSIVYDNGKVAKLITEEQPEGTRTFEITENWQDAIILRGAIDVKSGFKYRIEGASFSENGSSYGFEYEEKYKYADGIRLGMGFEMWAGI